MVIKASSQHKQSQTIALEHSETEGGLPHFFAKHGKNVILGLLAILILSFVIYNVVFRGNMTAESDFLNAPADFYQFQQGGSKASTAYTDLQQILKRQRGLQAKYDAPIAQTFLAENDSAKAQNYIDYTFTRTHNELNSSFYRYAQNSILITQGEFSLALENAKELKQILISELKTSTRQYYGYNLFAFNLLRIAFLEQELGNRSGEQNAWHQIKRYTSAKDPTESNVQPALTKAFRQMSAVFQEGQTSLSDYIAARERSLEKKA